MAKKPEPLPPGTYTMTVDRIRKVRNKPALRVHMRVIGGEANGRTFSEADAHLFSQVIKP